MDKVFVVGCASLSLVMLSSCARAPYYIPHYTPKVVSVVSATAQEGREKEYLSRSKGTEAIGRSYEDALLEAQMDDVASTTDTASGKRSSSTSQKGWFNEMLPSETDMEPEGREGSNVEHAHYKAEPYITRQKVHAADSSLLLWGQPAGSVGEGETLLDENLRRRLNDALATTPVEGEARWNVGTQQFIYMPNGPIYSPFRSGGSCRDGIFISYNGEMEEKVRGLFCRQGVGSDWYLMR